LPHPVVHAEARDQIVCSSRVAVGGNCWVGYGRISVTAGETPASSTIASGKGEQAAYEAEDQIDG
jgi:hypothetical protein